MIPTLSRTRLSLLPENWKAASFAITSSVLGVTVFVALLDCLACRGHLAPDYVRFYTSSLFPRTLQLCALAMLEETKYRLLVMTTIALVVAAILRRPPPPWGFALIIVASQLANVGGLVLRDPAYASLRYLAVGSVWGWLYWRYGWVSALVGHASTHLLLDPLLLAGLQ